MADRKVGESLTIEEVYEWEDELQAIYPNNQHVRETFRDIMQDFRDDGWIRFQDFEGNYIIAEDPKTNNAS